jgi:hypothetical protein
LQYQGIAASRFTCNAALFRSTTRGFGGVVFLRQEIIFLPIRCGWGYQESWFYVPVAPTIGAAKLAN